MNRKPNSTIGSNLKLIDEELKFRLIAQYNVNLASDPLFHLFCILATE